MRFHRSLGDVQVVSDFRVVTSLQQKIDNLPLPWPYLAEMFFHKKTAPHRHAPVAASGASGAETCPLGASGFGTLRLIFAFIQPKGGIDVN